MSIGTSGGASVVYGSLLGLLLLGPPLAAQNEAPPAPAGAAVSELQLGGRLLSTASSCSDGVCELWLLVVPREPGAQASRELDDERPRVLYRYRQQPSPDLAIVERELDPGIREVVLMDVDGDQRRDVLLASRERVVRTMPGREPETVLERPAIDTRGFAERVRPDSDVLPVVSVGRLAVYRRSGDALELQAVERLPLTAAVGSRSLRLESPPVHRVDRGDRWLIAVGPQEAGPGRWRVVLVQEGVGGGVESIESFVRTPAPERPVGVEWRWVERDSEEGGGHDLLMVAQALRSDRVGMFEKKKVRVYRIPTEPDADRSRAGSGPIFDVLTVSRLWQQLGVEIGDVDGDDVADLVLYQREGFSGRKLQIDVHSGVRRSGRLASFDDQSRRAIYDLAWPEWNRSADLDGDGVRDLLLLAEALYAFPGVSSGRDRGLPDQDPRWGVSLPEGAPRDVTASIDVGDSSSEDAEAMRARAEEAEAQERAAEDVTQDGAEIAQDPDEGRDGAPGEDPERDDRVRWRGLEVLEGPAAGPWVWTVGRHPDGDRLWLLRIGPSADG